MIIYDPKITGSFQVNGSTVTSIGEVDTISGSVAALNAATSSYALSSSISGSFTSLSASLSTRLTDDEGSITSLNAASSSYLLNTTDTLTGDLTVTGIITAQEFHTQYVSASIIYKSGSTQFGDSYDDTHSFTGSLQSIYSANGITGSFRARGGQVDIEGTDADLNFRLDSGSGASLGEIRFWVNQDQLGEINMHKGTGNMIIQNQTQTGYLSLRTGDGAVLNITGSSVGIGTTAPQSRLHTYASNDRAAIRIQNTAASKVWEITPAVPSTSNSGLSIHNFTDDEVYLHIENDGNVGIGNTNPLGKLQITTGDSGAAGAWTNADELILESSGNAGLAFQTPNTGAATIAFQDPESVQAGFIQYLHGDNLMRFATNGNNIRAVIDSSGKVGIGTTSPNETLQVDGNIRIGVAGNNLLFDTTGANSSNGIRTINDYETVIFNGRGAAGFAVIGNSDIRFGFGTSYTAAQTDLYIKSDGNVGIGTNAPTAFSGKILHIHDTSISRLKLTNGSTGTATTDGFELLVSGGDALLVNREAGAMTFSTSAQEAMRIDSNGEVGIGTNNPGTPLHIYGSAGTQLRIQNTVNSLYSEIHLQSQDGSGYIWRAASGYGGSQGGANALNIYNTGGGIVSIGTNTGSNTLNVKDGNVGIGTTSPGARLHVNGVFSLNSTYHGEKVLIFGPGSAFSINLPNEFPGMALTSGNTWAVIGDMNCFGSGGTIEVRTFYIGRNSSGTWTSAQYSASGANTGASLQSVTGSSNSITINMNTGSYLTVKLTVMIR